MILCIGTSERPKLPTVHTLYLDLLHKVYVCEGKVPWKNVLDMLRYKV